MTETQIALLTSNIFLAAWIGKHWMNGILFAAYAIAALLK
jgi:hypothetical protein